MSAVSVARERRRRPAHRLRLPVALRTRTIRGVPPSEADAAADPDVGELPRPLRRAWGVAGPSRTRGPRSGLALEEIVAAAVGLGDEAGLAAVSLTGVAARLGVTAPALYRHLDSREELLVLAREHALGVPGPRRPATAPWPDAAAVWAVALRARYRQHPWLAELPVRIPVTPHALTWLEALLEALVAAPFDTGQRLHVAALLDGHVRADTLAELHRSRGAPSLSADGPVTAAVARHLDEYDLPLVAAVFAEGRWSESAADAASGFQLGLTCLLGGLVAGGSELFTGVFPTVGARGRTSEGDRPRG